MSQQCLRQHCQTRGLQAQSSQQLQAQQQVQDQLPVQQLTQSQLSVQQQSQKQLSAQQQKLQQLPIQQQIQKQPQVQQHTQSLLPVQQQELQQLLVQQQFQGQPQAQQQIQDKPQAQQQELQQCVAQQPLRLSRMLRLRGTSLQQLPGSVPLLMSPAATAAAAAAAGLRRYLHSERSLRLTLQTRPRRGRTLKCHRRARLAWRRQRKLFGLLMRQLQAQLRVLSTAPAAATMHSQLQVRPCNGPC